MGFEVFSEQNSCVIDNGVFRPLTLDPEERVVGQNGRDYGFRGITFGDSLNDVSNGGLYTLPAGTISRIVLITGDITCQTYVVSGDGYLLSSKSGVADIESTKGLRKRKLPFEYGKGSVVCFQALTDLKLLEIYTPPYGENMELVVPTVGQLQVNGIPIAHEFWTLYKSYQFQLPKPQIPA